MAMQVALTKLMAIMPFLFGIGFIAPVIGQGLTALGWTAPFGLEPIVFGLIVGSAWGLYATIRGRWI